MEDKKKVEIPEDLLQVVEEERLNEILKQVEDTENDLGINQEVTKEVLNMMKGKTFADLTHTIIALCQVAPVYILHSIYGTLGTMLKVSVLKELKNKLKAEVDKAETSKEDE